MSIKPINHQITFLNMLNESKNCQNQLNKAQESKQFLQLQQQAVIERNKNRVADTENTKSKIIGKEKKEQDFKDSKKQKKGNNSLNDNTQKKGMNIDIFI